MGVWFLTFCLFFLGVRAAQDREFQTLECSILQSRLCFKTIAPLGGDSTGTFADNEMELNDTCQKEKFFDVCITNVPGQCYDKNATAQLKVQSVVAFVRKLCTNRSEEQNNFLNSSVCYNKYQKRRLNCERGHASSKRDSESLCCQHFKIQDCMKSDLRNVCPKNSTDFQDKLSDTYNSYVDFLCNPYRKRCNGSGTNFLSVFCVLLVLKLHFLKYSLL